MNFWIENIMASGNKKPLPVLSFPGARLIDVTVGDLVADGKLQARCLEAVAERWETAARTANMDLSVEAEAFGSKIVFSDNEVPTVVGRMVETFEDAAALIVPPPGAGRTGECIKAVETAARLSDGRPLLAGVIGPFSLAGRLMDMTEIMIKCIIEPETAHLTLEKAERFITSYIRALKEAGADGVLMAEPAAGLLSPNLCRDFSTRYVKSIIDKVQDDTFLVVYHNCGNTLPLIETIIDTGARAFHFGNAVSLAEIITKIPADRLVMGNIDPSGSLLHGTPEQVRQETSALIEEMRGHRNFVLSTGCDIPPMTPLENIDAFFEAAAGRVLREDRNAVLST
jgi:uroporphyrinogen decarboxylase